MSYVKTQWVNGDTITADKLNHIEAGIEANENENSLLKSHLGAVEIVDTASGAIATFADGSDGVPVEGLMVQIEPVQSGTGDPSPENIRPISGRTEVNVYQSAANHIITTAANTSFDSHVIRGYPSNNASYMTRVYTKLEPGTYTLSYMVKLGSNFIPRAYVTFTDGTEATITGMYFDDNTEATAAGLSADSFKRVHRTFMIEKPCNYLRLGNYANNAYSYYDYNYGYRGFKIEKGELSDADGSETIYTIQLGDTIYGSLDVTSGVLTADRKLLDLGTLTYTKSTRVVNAFVATGGMPDDFPIAPSQYNTPNWLCSRYRIYNNSQIESQSINYGITWRVSGQNKGVIIKDFNFSDLYASDDMTAFKAAMDGVQLCYELASPITIQLSAQQLTTLKGQNNIWSDAGDVAVDYVADTKLYIQKAIAAALANV